MAMMFNMAQDWTYDLFLADVKAYTGTPIKGVRRPNASDREQFVIWLKNAVRDFRAEWTGNDWDADRFCYIGDVFMSKLDDMYFSDYYKDTYGQRPHLARWFYVTVLGLPTGQDVTRKFCATPVEDAARLAKHIREEVA